MTRNRPTTPHPDEVQTASYIEGSLTGGIRDEFEAHLCECNSCRVGIALLRSGETPVAGPVPREFLERGRRVLPASRSRWLRVGTGAAAAAAVLLILGVGFWTTRLRPSGPAGSSVFRGEAAGPFAEVVPSSGSVVVAKELNFHWSPVEGADRYVLLVYDTRGETLATFSLGPSERSLSWPEDRPLPSPGRLVWKLRALALDRVIAETRPIPFEVR